MKINEFGPIGKLNSSKKKNAKSNIDSNFGSILDGASAAEGTSSPAEAAAPSSIGMIDSLIAIQQVESQYGNQQESLRHGKEVLDFLDEMRQGMLGGGISAEKLQKLKSSVEKERGTATDEKLSSVLNEIETRAKVEIAKLDIKS